MRSATQCQRDATTPLYVRAVAHHVQLNTEHDVSLQFGRMCRS